MRWFLFSHNGSYREYGKVKTALEQGLPIRQHVIDFWRTWLAKLLLASMDHEILRKIVTNFPTNRQILFHYFGSNLIILFLNPSVYSKNNATSSKSQHNKAVKKWLKKYKTKSGTISHVISRCHRLTTIEKWEVVEVLEAAPAPRDSRQEKPQQTKPRIRAMSTTSDVSGNHIIYPTGTQIAAGTQRRTQAHKATQSWISLAYLTYK